MTAILDAWAIVAYLRNGPAVARAEEVMTERPVMTGINLGEVFYILHRWAGPQASHETVRDLDAKLDVETPDSERVLAAATIKAEHRLSYADAFAAATALAHDVALLTGDPELLGDDVPWRSRICAARGAEDPVRAGSSGVRRECITVPWLPCPSCVRASWRSATSASATR